jgi:hypothetical protein
MGFSDWLVWACILYLQQFTFLFSGRAKASGSLKYSALAGIGSHGSWFFANLYFITTVMHFKDSPLWQQLLVCLFYMTFTICGTVSGQWVALKYLEKGKLQVGAR